MSSPTVPRNAYTHAPEQHPTEGEEALNYLSTSRQRWAAQARQLAIA